MSKDSAYTSLNQIPAVLKNYQLGKVNLDVGGGKYEKATQFLKKCGTLNLVYDPYNRNNYHNTKVVELALSNKLDTITCLNVLNVIRWKKERIKVLENIRKFVHHQKHQFDNDVVVFFSIYEKNGNGKADEGLAQTNMKTADYIPEIQAVFPEWELQREGNVIIL